MENVEIIEGRYEDLPHTGRNFDLVTSACGLTWSDVGDDRGDDIPPTAIAADRFQLSPLRLEQIDAVAGQALTALRQCINPDGTLAMVERLSTFQNFASFLTIASRAGWKFDVERSTRLRFRDEALPAMIFVPSISHELEIDLRRYVDLWQGADYRQLPVIDEAAIIAYLDRAPLPGDISRQDFDNGTMFTERGSFADGSRYEYRYATTGFRELKIV